MTIIITGASGGIGKFLFKQFHSSGMEVFGTFNSTKPFDLPPDHLVKADISVFDEVKYFINQLPISGKELVLINCAGINYNAFGHKADPVKWEAVIDVNLKGSFYIAANILPIMREVGFGRIIFLSSVVAQLGIPGTSAYAASKSGLWGLTRTLAIENASKGITVNCINLGYFDIGIIKEVPEEMQQVIKKKIAVGKFGDPHEILNLIKFLISSQYTTGSLIDINGGLV
jgi:NAD(P)-dependent dehydrogenase (short-subunit alcohol dehydrogenase family)